MSSQSLTSTRTLRRPRHLDLRIILGLVLALTAVGGGLASWSAANETRGVLIALRDLPIGATLRSDDLAIAQVHMDDALYAAALPAAELAAIVGQRLGEPAHAGQVLARGQLATRRLLAAGELALTIAVRPETAAGGRLRPGDSVRVLVTRDKGKPDSSTTIVLERVVVYEVGYDVRLSVGVVGGDQAENNAGGPVASLTLIVTPEQAELLANAKWNGDLDVALLPTLGEAAPTGTR